MLPLYIFDPTAADAASRVRGIGRYLQILRESSVPAVYTSSLSDIPYESIFLNPFFNFIQRPLLIRRIAKIQATVIHDLIPLKYPEHFPVGLRGNMTILLNKLALRSYDTVITDSQASQTDIQRMLGVTSSVLYPTTPGHLAPSKNISEASLRKQYGLPESFCIYVGDATWNKNLLAMAMAVKKADVSCVIVGRIFKHDDPEGLTSPWQAELKAFLDTIRGDNRFIVVGYVPDEELALLYRMATANILVSRDEGFGFSYLEAAMHATPSVLSAIPVFQETAKDTALFADPTDPQAIAHQIRALIDHPKRADTLGAAARRRSTHYSTTVFRQTLMEILYNENNP